METLTRDRSGTGRGGTVDAEELVRLMGQLRRTIRRGVRRDWPHTPLVESEVEVVRLVHDRPGLRVRQAAELLGVAPNTLSTLVGRLADLGLVERRPDPVDARAARLHLTAAARRRVSAWRDRRQHLVSAALDRLDTSDRRAIAAALPSIHRLLECLEDGA